MSEIFSSAAVVIGPLRVNAGQKYCRMLQADFPSSFSYNLFIKIFVLSILSDRLRQVLLYIHEQEDIFPIHDCS